MKYYNYLPSSLTQWSPEFDCSYIHTRYKTHIEDNYMLTLRRKNKIECINMKKLYNKYEVKKFFEKQNSRFYFQDNDGNSLLFLY